MKRPIRHQITSIVYRSPDGAVEISRTGTVFTLFVHGRFCDERDAREDRECVETLQRRGVEVLAEAA